MRAKSRDDPKHLHVGQWSWNNELLWSKIEVSLDTEQCWLWQGSMSPSGALFGAFKNAKAQMTQARRLVWMSENLQDVTPYQITLSCANQQCCNPNHFVVKPNNRPDNI